MRVLLVDDEELSRRALRVTLSRHVSHVEIIGEAVDGHEAIELAERLRPDLIIMDIKMPEINGIEAARRLREAGDTARLVFLTAHDDFEYARTAIDLRADAYLMKPVRRTDLLRVIEDCTVRLEADAHRALDQTDTRVVWLRRWAEQQIIRAVVEGDPERFSSLMEGFGHRFSGGTLVLLRAARRTVEAVDRLARADRTVMRWDWDDRTAVFLFMGPITEGLIHRVAKRCDAVEDRSWRIRAIDVSSPGEHSRVACRTAVVSLDDDEPVRWIRCEQREERSVASAVSALTPKVRATVEHVVTRAAVDADVDSLIDDLLRPLVEEPFDLNGVRLFVMDVLTLLRLQIGDSVPAKDPVFLLLPVLAAGTVREVVARGRAAIRELIARPDGQPHYSWRLARAIEWIDQRLETDLSLERVAAAVGIGSQHMSRLFKDELGTSFIRHVTDRRIERARFLLMTTALNVTEVADRVGFRDANYFGKVFRRVVGCTPSRYRERFAGPPSVATSSAGL